MELSAIIYSTLAIVFFLIVLILVVSYVGYKIKQREEAIQNASLFDYQKFRIQMNSTGERKWQ